MSEDNSFLVHHCSKVNKNDFQITKQDLHQVENLNVAFALQR